MSASSLAPQVRLEPNCPDPWGRGALAMVCGYLCCVAGFEWSRLWDFSPYPFQAHAAIPLTIALLIGLILHQKTPRERPIIPTVKLAWVGLAAWPLHPHPIVATLLFSMGSLFLVTTSLRGRKATAGVALALPLALALLFGVWQLPITVLLLAGALFEMVRPSFMEMADEIEERKRNVEQGPTVELFWKGFAALFKVAAPGEGERFTTTVLADTAKIVEACQGTRIRGSDLNGVYRFPDQTSLEDCLAKLQRYEESTTEVLEGAGAPPLRLLIDRR